MIPEGSCSPLGMASVGLPGCNIHVPGWDTFEALAGSFRETCYPTQQPETLTLDVDASTNTLSLYEGVCDVTSATNVRFIVGVKQFVGSSWHNRRSWVRGINGAVEFVALSGGSERNGGDAGFVGVERIVTCT